MFFFGRSEMDFFRNGSADPDPDQNETDPQHCLKYKFLVPCNSKQSLTTETLFG